MPSPKPKWGYSGGGCEGAVTKSTPTDDFIDYIMNILNLNIEMRKGVTSQFTAMLTIYKLAKKHSSRTNPECPTSGETMAAAQSIIKDINSLSKKLEKGAGGIRDYYENYDPNKKLEWGERRNFGGIRSELDTLQKCCESIIQETNKSNLPPSVSAKQSVVSSIAYWFRHELNIEPTIYISDDHGTSSVYAKVLTRFFIEADEGKAPQNLKALMIDERKQWCKGQPQGFFEEGGFLW